ncbi:MAG: multiheme c-type cytochrome [Myxococcota bacterium]
MATAGAGCKRRTADRARRAARALARCIAAAALLAGSGCNPTADTSTTSTPAEAVGGAAPAAPAREEARWLGSERCGACHEREARAWRGSHHERAMQPANAASVVGAFDGRARTLDGERWVPEQPEPGRFRFLVGEGEDAREALDVAFAFGVFPLQQYLVAAQGGRLQALPVAWDARPARAGGARWIHLYEGEGVRPGDELHWRARAQTWNAQCAPCHATNLARGYDAETDTYATTWSETGVGCEACHGPGAAHVAWAGSGAGAGAAPDPYAARPLRGRGPWTLRAGRAIAERAPGAPASNELDACAPCHSRRMQLAPHPDARAPYLDGWLPALLDDGLYFADGQMRDEVYVYGSFVQSRMHAAGVSCSDCHDPHSLAIAAPGAKPAARDAGAAPNAGARAASPDAACARCHAPATFATRAHHGHAAGSPGASCVACHMPTRTYMQVDVRRDHAMRVPRPDVAHAIGAPDACSACHGGQSAAWAAEVLAERGAKAGPHFALAIARARAAALDRTEHAALVEVARDEALAPIARATALSLVEPFRDNASLRAVEAALASDDALVRIGALRALEHVPPDARVGLARRLLRDGVRAVRIEAARVLAEAPPRAFPPGERATLVAPLAELRAAYAANADRAEAQLGLAALESALGDGDAALAHARRARELAPRLAAAVVNLADLLRARGRDTEALALLERAVGEQPDDASLQYALGLALVRADGDGRPDGALAALARASALAPESGRFAFAHALALDAAGRRDEAVAALTALAAREPGNADALAALATFERDRGRLAEALAFAQRLADARPDDARGRALVEELGAATRAN